MAASRLEKGVNQREEAWGAVSVQKVCESSQRTRAVWLESQKAATTVIIGDLRKRDRESLTSI